jgi:hypothetical protein
MVIEDGYGENTNKNILTYNTQIVGSPWIMHSPLSHLLLGRPARMRMEAWASSFFYPVQYCGSPLYAYLICVHYRCSTVP